LELLTLKQRKSVWGCGIPGAVVIAGLIAEVLSEAPWLRDDEEANPAGL